MTAITIEVPSRHNVHLMVRIDVHSDFHMELVRPAATDPLLSQVVENSELPSVAEDGEQKNREYG